ncbi:MAG TPA: DUF1801 domain-containing protein [Pedobacter sp.]
MNKDKKIPESIDEYIDAFPIDIQQILEKLRDVIKKAAPAAKETISYQIPTFKLEGNLVHFAAYKHHIGFYPGPDAVATFRKELSAYQGSKGTVKFQPGKPVPFDLIGRIVEFRVKMNMEKAAAKKISREMAKNKPSSDNYLSLLATPAKRALESKKITTLQQLSRFSEAEILNFHGVGPASIPKLRAALQEKGLSFRK